MGGRPAPLLPRSAPVTLPTLLPGTPWAAALPALVALALALWSLNFGLPFALRPDEDVMVGRAVRMVVEGSLDPRFYNYPPFAFLVLAAAEWLLRAFHLGALGAADRVDPTAAYLAARAVSAASATAATVFVFFAARRTYGLPAAIVAGLMLAVAPLAVRQAHFATTDALQEALVAATLSAAAAAGRRTGLAWAGLLAGLAAATKYTGGLVVLAPLVIAVAAAHPPGERLRRLAAVAAAAAAGFALPFLAAGHPQEYLAGLGFLGGRAAAPAGTPAGIVFHTTVTLPYGLGLGAFVAALGGIGVAAARRTSFDLALLAVLAAVLAVNGPTHEVFFRYLLPALPVLALLAGGALRAVPRVALPAATGVLVALLLPSLYASIETDRLLGEPDTRALAAAWLQDHEPAGATVAQSSYFAELFYGRAQLAGNPLHELYHAGDPIADSFQLGRYTDRFPAVTSSGRVTVLESGPPAQGPPPAASGPVLATFSPGAAGGAVYDPQDAFYLPIWGFEGLARAGPSIILVGR